MCMWVWVILPLSFLNVLLFSNSNLMFSLVGIFYVSKDSFAEYMFSFAEYIGHENLRLTNIINFIKVSLRNKQHINERAKESWFC